MGNTVNNSLSVCSLILMCGCFQQGCMVIKLCSSKILQFLLTWRLTEFDRCDDHRKVVCVRVCQLSLRSNLGQCLNGVCFFARADCLIYDGLTVFCTNLNA